MVESRAPLLQLWDSWASGPAVQPLSPEAPAANLDALVLAEAMGPASALLRGQGPDAFSMQWFLDLEALRHQRYARWLPRALEFSKHAGDTFLGWGLGLGSDWAQFARQGASVIACGPCPQHLLLSRRNFELRGLSARFILAPGRHLPVESGCVDVACLNALQPMVPSLAELAEEAYRVLKPGGKVLVLAPARYDVDYWQRWLMPWQRWFAPAPAAWAAPTFSARRLRHTFHRFVEPRASKRHLRRVDIPHLWRVVPTFLLERLAGQVMVLKAFKPLSAALPVSLAA